MMDRSGFFEAVRRFFDRPSGRRSGHWSPKRQAAVVQATERCEDRVLLTFDIVFDYTYDSTGFFSQQSQRDVLEQAAATYEARITDDLTAITPSGVDSWTAIFNDPSTGSQVNLSNPTIPADTIIVYVGARPQTSGLAVGGPGGFSSFATPAFNENLKTRGEPGVDPDGSSDTDFSLWGGTISFNSDTSWNLTMDPPASGQNDLYSVALHELGHVLGVGTAESFLNLVDGSNRFIGTETVAAAGAPVAMHSDGLHFASGTTGVLPGTSTVQEVSFDPQITTGTRKLLTNVDWAALDDLGWDVTPVLGSVDYGDAPDAGSGTGPGDYQTRVADNGPSHTVVAGLFIGSAVDGDDGTLQDVNATADDLAGTDDEDFSGADNLVVIEGVAPSIVVNVTNTTSTAATLYGWIDYNGDGTFTAGTESANVVVDAGTNNGSVTLNFPVVPSGTAGSTFARFRLSSDTAAADPFGPASGGEVEDHAVTILTQAAAYDPLPLFTWSAVPGALRYELEVNNVTTGQNQFLLQSELTSTSYRPSEALPPGHFQWRYRAHDGTNWLPFSPFTNLNIFAKTGIPLFTDPVTSSVDSLPTFAWSHIEGATRYELWVNETSRPLVIYDAQVPTASLTPSEGLAAGTYTAWVRAYNGSTPLGSWSQPLSFTLSEAVSSVLTDPVGSSTTTAPVFGWLPTSFPGYTLRIDNLSSSVTDFVVAENLSGTSYSLPDGLPPGSYSATIQATGAAESSPVTFQVQQVNGQAELTLPRAASENPLPVFAWTSVAGATRYELWVDDISRGVSVVIHDSQLTDTAYAVRQPLQPGLYRAWVRAFSGSSSIGTWSAARDYTVRQATDIPTIWAPSGTVDRASPLFVWSDVDGADSYTVSFGFGPTGGTGSLPLTQTKVTSNTLQLDSAFAAGDYEVTVTALDSSGSTLGTHTRRFVISPISAGGTPQMYAPAASETASTPTFAWSAVSGASRYILWLNDVTRNVNAFIYRNDLTASVFTPNDALQPGTYRVWVRAYNGASPVSNWSSGKTFTIAESSGPPVITLPMTNTVNSVPAISWGHVAGAVRYDIEVIDQSAPQTPLFSDTTTSALWRPPQAIAPGNYTVQVRSVDSLLMASAWSSRDLIVEAATAPTIFSPLAKESTAAASLFFAWSAATDATRYELWVNNLTTGQVKVIYDSSITGQSFTPNPQLAAGDYRAWVRGIHADNSTTAWSAGVDFTVAAHTQSGERTRRVGSLKEASGDLQPFFQPDINVFSRDSEALIAGGNAAWTQMTVQPPAVSQDVVTRSAIRDGMRGDRGTHRKDRGTVGPENAPIASPDAIDTILATLFDPSSASALSL